MVKLVLSSSGQRFALSQHSVLFLGIILLWKAQSVESRIPGHYENFCKDDTDCSAEEGLTCHNQQCRCAPGGETVFSISKNRCVGAAGRECLRTSNGTLCVDNSICRDYNYMFLCVCNDNFYQSRDGNCYRTAQYGEPCREEDYACGDSVTTSISCVERRCSCLLGENQYYDPVQGRCISFAGSQCLYQYSTQNPCSMNSYCAEVAENINGASFIVGHRCLCKTGFSYTRNRKCMARYGTQCGPDNPCNYDDHLGCLNGICQCRNPLSEVIDERSGQCKIIVGSRCNSDSGPKCVANAECVGGDENSSSSRTPRRCECSRGYSATPIGTCLLDINQKCEPGTCNHYNALTCVNGTCACVDSSLNYDKNTKVCMAKVGQPCGQVQIYDKGTMSQDEREIIVYCEGNAICSKNQMYSGVSANSSNMKRICKGTGGPTTTGTSSNPATPTSPKSSSS